MLRFKKYRYLPAALLLTVALSACQSSQDAPKQTVGTLLGAGVGALVGSQVGSGKGKMVAMVVGTLGGAFLGSEIGKSLDSADRLMMEKNAQKSLEYSKAGTATAWKNPDSGNSGTFKPTRTYASAGETCREYESTIYVDGKEETATGTACRQADGTWKISS